MSTPPPTFSHTGYRYLLGYDAAGYGIWDRNSPGSPPVQTFPRTDEGWATAWTQYTSMEPQNAAVGGPTAFAAPPPLPPQYPYPGASTGTGSGTKVLVGIAIGVGVLFIIGILVAIALPTFLGARDRATDKAAMSNLRNGVAVAKVYFTDNDTYEGFDWMAGEAIEPDLIWNDSPVALRGQVSVRGVDQMTVVLVVKSESGKTLCLADDATTGITYGQVDAQSVAECQGGWPGLD